MSVYYELGFRLIVSFVTIIITYYIIPYLKSKNVYNEALILVKAAEQIFVGEKRGEEKYAYVCNILSQKFKLSEDEIKSIIESAVYEIKRGLS